MVCFGFVLVELAAVIAVSVTREEGEDAGTQRANTFAHDAEETRSWALTSEEEGMLEQKLGMGAAPTSLEHLAQGRPHGPRGKRRPSAMGKPALPASGAGPEASSPKEEPVAMPLAPELTTSPGKPAPVETPSAEELAQRKRYKERLGRARAAAQLPRAEKFFVEDGAAHYKLLEETAKGRDPGSAAEAEAASRAIYKAAERKVDAAKLGESTAPKELTDKEEIKAMIRALAEKKGATGHPELKLSLVLESLTTEYDNELPITKEEVILVEYGKAENGWLKATKGYTNQGHITEWFFNEVHYGSNTDESVGGWGKIHGLVPQSYVLPLDDFVSAFLEHDVDVDVPTLLRDLAIAEEGALDFGAAIVHYKQAFKRTHFPDALAQHTWYL